MEKIAINRQKRLEAAQKDSQQDNGPGITPPATSALCQPDSCSEIGLERERTPLAADTSERLFSEIVELEPRERSASQDSRPRRVESGNSDISSGTVGGTDNSSGRNVSIITNGTVTCGNSNCRRPCPVDGRTRACNFQHVPKSLLPSDPLMYWRLTPEEHNLITKLTVAYQVSAALSHVSQWRIRSVQPYHTSHSGVSGQCSLITRLTVVYQVSAALSHVSQWRIRSVQPYHTSHSGVSGQCSRITCLTVAYQVSAALSHVSQWRIRSVQPYHTSHSGVSGQCSLITRLTVAYQVSAALSHVSQWRIRSVQPYHTSHSGVSGQCSLITRLTVAYQVSAALSHVSQWRIRSVQPYHTSHCGESGQYSLITAYQICTAISHKPRWRIRSDQP